MQGPITLHEVFIVVFGIVFFFYGRYWRNRAKFMAEKADQMQLAILSVGAPVSSLTQKLYQMTIEIKDEFYNVDSSESIVGVFWDKEVRVDDDNAG